MKITELQDKLINLNIDIPAREICKIWGMDEASFSRKKKAGTEIKIKNIRQLECQFNIKLLDDNINILTDLDIINIHYWSELPEELKHPEYPFVLAQRVSIEKGWNVKPDNLCIVPMVGDKLSKYWYPINDGDILIIDTSYNFIRGNGVYFATSRNNTRFWVREMQVLVNDDLEIKGFSPSGETTRVLTRQQLEDVGFRIVGKVIKNVSFRL